MRGICSVFSLLLSFCIANATAKTSSLDLDLLTISTPTGWNHVTSDRHWQNLSRSPSAYAPPASVKQPIAMTLVKKYGDWHQQHSNGLILDLTSRSQPFASDASLTIRYRVMKNNSHLLSDSELTTQFQSLTSEPILEKLDDGNAYIEGQLRAGEDWAYSFTLDVSPNRFNQWQTISIPLENMDKWMLENYRRINKTAGDFQSKRISNVMFVAETKTRKVLRNFINPLPEGFEESFKELTLEIESMRLSTSDNAISEAE